MSGVGVAVAVPAGASMIAAPAAEAAAPAQAPVKAVKVASVASTVKTAKTASPRAATDTNVQWLVYGSTGSLVKTAQQRLGGIAVDGSFGPATLRRVVAYQAANRLLVDGKIGPATWKSLGGYPGNGGSTPSCQVTTLRFGATGELVRTAQSRLGGIAVDGSFGPATLARVKQYQGQKKLPITGAIDAATWTALGGMPCAGGNGGGTGGGGTGGGTGGGGTVGNPNAPYRMPFLKGSTYKITQGPGGSWSHHTDYNRHGIDFGMPIGTPVVAARSGVVQDTGYTSMGGGMYVRVKDASGFCQVYFHLSAYQVTPGQPVAQGQRLATSGNTGNSSGPHLHFGILNCNTWMSATLPDSVERGTNYTTGAMVTSTNG